MAEGKFIVEGAKNVLELVKSDFEIDSFFVTSEFLIDCEDLLDQVDAEVKTVKESDLVKLGTFKTNNAALAIAKIPEIQNIDSSEGLVLAFDRISDPGNLGTIIRIADWYGVKSIVCSEDSVDCFNPKVVNSTMGSFTRVKVHYRSLVDLIDDFEHVYATHLDGENLHEAELEEPALVLFGNESSGLHEELATRVSKKIKIPGYGGAESLNVAVSTAVFCDNFKRMIKGK